MRLIASLALSVAVLATPAMAEVPTMVAAEVGSVSVTRVATGIVHPWALAFLPDGRKLVTERNDGHLRLVGRDGAVSAPVANVPDIFRYVGPTDGRSQGGLFDVRLHPDFARNQQIYLSFSKPTQRGAAVAIVRARLVEEGGARLEAVEPIFEMQEADQDSSGIHFGGRMAIDAEGDALYLAIGDRRNMSRAQEKGDQAGKILRLTLDGAPHPDNVRADAESDPHIFAMGSRNSQALALGGGALWSAEHGPLGGDRLDRVASGDNLGWPLITAGRDYSEAPIGFGQARDGLVSPTHVFAETVAPSGATFYDGAMFAGWRGDLLIGGLANESLMRIRIAGDRVAAVEQIEIGRRIRDVAVAPDGAIYLVTEHEDGEILRLTLG